MSTPSITDYPASPGIKTMSVGTLQCTIWKGPSSIQVAANNNGSGTWGGPLILNQIGTVGPADLSGDILVPGVGYVVWLFKQGVTPGQVDYDIGVGVDPYDSTNPPKEESGTF